MRSWRIIGLVALLSWTQGARAQTIDSFDAVGLERPVQGSAFAGLRTAQPFAGGAGGWGVRVSYLHRPLSARLPSPSDRGTSAALVAGLVLSEFGVGLRLPAGFDGGIGFGAHLFQWGAGNEATARGAALPPFAARDPRFVLGYSAVWAKAQLRPFIDIRLPLGNHEAFAAERSFRLESGAVFSWVTPLVVWTTEASFFGRQTVSIASTTWGHQIRMGTGARLRLPAEWWTGVEILAAPVVTSQASDANATVLPAEAIASLSHRGKSHLLVLGGGPGLPLSRLSENQDKRPFVRGPTSPVFRSFVDLSFFY